MYSSNLWCITKRASQHSAQTLCLGSSVLKSTFPSTTTINPMLPMENRITEELTCPRSHKKSVGGLGIEHGLLWGLIQETCCSCCTFYLFFFCFENISEVCVNVFFWECCQHLLFQNVLYGLTLRKLYLASATVLHWRLSYIQMDFPSMKCSWITCSISCSSV